MHLKPLDIMARSVPELQNHILSENDWKVLEEMKNWLKVGSHGNYNVEIVMSLIVGNYLL